MLFSNIFCIFSVTERIAFLTLTFLLLVSQIVNIILSVNGKQRLLTSPQHEYSQLRADIMQKAELLVTSSAGANDIMSDQPQFKIDLNRASIEELMTIPSIGPVLAERIVTYRTIHGNFKKIDDVVNVKGIGRVTLKKIKTYLTIQTNTNSRRRENGKS